MDRLPSKSQGFNAFIKSPAAFKGLFSTSPAVGNCTFLAPLAAAEPAALAAFLSLLFFFPIFLAGTSILSLKASFKSFNFLTESGDPEKKSCISARWASISSSVLHLF